MLTYLWEVHGRWFLRCLINTFKLAFTDLPAVRLVQKIVDHSKIYKINKWLDSKYSWSFPSARLFWIFTINRFTSFFLLTGLVHCQNGLDEAIPATTGIWLLGSGAGDNFGACSLSQNPMCAHHQHTTSHTEPVVSADVYRWRHWWTSWIP